MADENPNFGNELAALDFAQLLGGPMIATIDAQAQSAMKTLAFIRNPVFIDNGAIKTVDFSFQKQVPVPGGNGRTQLQAQQLTVPMLSMVPIPFIRVESLTIDLNVKLSSVQTAASTNTFEVNTDVNSNKWFSPVSMTVHATDRNTVTHNSTVDRTYTMGVHLRAVQDQIPGGLSKILDIFEQAIESQAKGGTAT